MSVEITVLALGGLLTVAQLALMSVPANLQLGTRKTTGPRDEPLALTGVPGRLHRAAQNMLEALPLYAAAAVAVVMADKSSALTEGCAVLWLAARIAYVPLYALGIGPWRSYIWMIALLCATLMLIAALL